MTSAKPTIILTPGSWHVPAHFQPTTDILVAHGYKVVGVRTPSMRESGPWTANYSADAGAVASAILTEVDQGNEVVLVMHSYGGIPGSAAVEGLSKSEREKKGLKGGVIRLVYLAAIVLDVGMSAFKMFLKEDAAIQQFIEDGKIEGYWTTIYDKCRTWPQDPIDHFYHDVEEGLAKKAVGLLQHQCLGATTEEQRYAAFKHIPSTYIICEEDRAIPMEAQEMFIAQGGLWTTVRMKNVSHSPFLSKPEETAAVIEEAAMAKS